jgi:hypothetical protein
LRLGFLVPACCVFAGLRLIVRRRLTEPCLGPTTVGYHIMRAVVHHSKIGRPMTGRGQNEKPPFSALCQLCPAADIPPKMLTAAWCHKPTYAVQQRARVIRSYRR